MRYYKIAILASGSGSNAENIVKYFQDSDLARVAIVLTNKSGAKVVDRMQPYGIDTQYLPNDIWDNKPQQVVDILNAHTVDIVALAGFLHYVSPVILNAFPGRVLNIHPSLLPAYGGKGMWGRRVHEAVLSNGETESGATVHKVSAVMDDGEVVLVQKVPVYSHDTLVDLETRVHEAEYVLYPKAIEKIIYDMMWQGDKKISL